MMHDPNSFPCCGAATFGEHLANVAAGECSRAKLSAILGKAASATVAYAQAQDLERALAAAEQIARAGAR
jgi:anthranilate phosphoribosyltransferase